MRRATGNGWERESFSMFRNSSHLNKESIVVEPADGESQD